MASRIRTTLHLTQQFFPFPPRQTAIVEIRARPFAPMIEEANVVVLLLKGLDLSLDKGVEHLQVVSYFTRNFEIQETSP